jgi:2,3-dihydroxyphenylpropionate 1,2-dioxygenase
MKLMASGDLTQIDSWVDEDVTQTAGGGGHEVRTWAAAFAALNAASDAYNTNVEFYDAVQSWMTGMGVVCAR